ncbi:hypothetical protein C3Y87_14070 [Carbonactinospora thermoautotrophica]|uniref:Uncharacterized protein n=1 Tax=Carbonactinospora thermoautotrophica TaxID=1469144 RepID=A0A132NE38_9ACTN|nr:hypothetical protein [Carbonactinospora thermoautotrophica]KWX04187.1 hypothetical protein TH66_09895 [Carbonactinospora thermoautotrophica]KWX08383.1 hypothetical protein TR74_15260 [Carbonactinospora thermoautotrophica]MCX9192520.1 hypothetical protein [Carbonactinospora thermoautotrophica]
MASIALWWAIPALGLVMAIGWAVWASRPKRPADVFESVESYRRFREAMEHDNVVGLHRTSSSPEDATQAQGRRRS